ncbi:hypothetical protein A2Y83_04685 [Candidatus Falkowbacteria bacterium RBG_13_39_14]|uniref:V-ATPase subunit E n=1 Tax=Candidatus Falkowbacteria bacterium RBG_13_39_14 TaxID=1797985 RepID=A0A1F5S7M8_9BACT|nr:MAG: hypothetical protein A2Y83_04685 [Candidatus Falkowbacteria bacterium RBG_13_39_14]
MPLYDIIKTIEESANAKISEINKEFDEKINSLIEEYNGKISKKESEFLNSAKNEIKTQVKKEKFLLNTQEAKIILEKRWSLIDKVYGKVLDKLAAMDSEEKEKFFHGLLKNCPAKGNIIAPQNDKKILEKIKGDGQTIAETNRSSKGGFIFEGEKARIDNSFENIIASIQEETEVEVGKILFGQN